MDVDRGTRQPYPSAGMLMKDILQPIHPEIRAGRVILRMPEEGDGALVHEAVAESLEDLRRWPASLPWVLTEPSVEASEIFCRTSRVQSLERKRLSYLVLDAETSKLAGCMGIPRLDWSVPKFEIGFWCRVSAQGRGLMTEALTTLIGFLGKTYGARRVDCWTDSENVRAKALCERAGMTHEATLHNERANPDGTLRHTVVYSVLESIHR